MPARLEQVLALNLAKEVRKDTMVIHAAAAPAEAALDVLVERTKGIDRDFLERVAHFPVRVLVRYEEIEPVRRRRIERLFVAAQRVLAAWVPEQGAREALCAAFPGAQLETLLHELLSLYGEETLALSRSVRVPVLLRPLRDAAARRLVAIMDRVSARLAKEAAAAMHLR
ncbi:MAG TPA: hypothetical protein VFC18_09875 [Burkholderiales bacterium]|nr:hypothetical protein [Burkholderiales bacterium]